MRSFGPDREPGQDAIVLNCAVIATKIRRLVAGYTKLQAYTANNEAALIDPRGRPPRFRSGPPGLDGRLGYPAILLAAKRPRFLTLSLFGACCIATPQAL